MNNMKDIITATLEANDANARAEELTRAFFSECNSDDESWSKIGYSLLRGIAANDAEHVLLALCGWSMETMMRKAHILRDVELRDDAATLTVKYTDGSEQEYDGYVVSDTLEFIVGQHQKPVLDNVESMSVKFDDADESFDALRDTELPEGDIIHVWVRTTK